MQAVKPGEAAAREWFDDLLREATAPGTYGDFGIVLSVKDGNVLEARRVIEQKKRMQRCGGENC